MTRDEIIALIVDELARPNDTYVAKVLPLRLNEAIRTVERKWDWNFQYMEPEISVISGTYEISFSIPNKELKEISNNIYNVEEKYLCKYKKFYPFLVSDIPARPLYYTVTPAKKIYLSARVPSECSFYVPMRAYTTSFTSHPLFSEYPLELAHLVQVMCRKDFIGTIPGYTRDDWLNDYKDVMGKLQDANMAEKENMPAIIQLNYDIRRDLSYVSI